jgi:hypothetical protein
VLKCIALPSNVLCPLPSRRDIRDYCRYLPSGLQLSEQIFQPEHPPDSTATLVSSPYAPSTKTRVSSRVSTLPDKRLILAPFLPYSLQPKFSLSLRLRYHLNFLSWIHLLAYQVQHSLRSLELLRRLTMTYVLLLVKFNKF